MNNAEKNNVDALIILVYTGLRYSELVNLEKEDIHINERWLDVKGTKVSDLKDLFKKWILNSDDNADIQELNDIVINRDPKQNQRIALSDFSSANVRLNMK